MKTQTQRTSSIRQSIPCYIIMLSCYNWKIISEILNRLFHLKIQSIFKMFHTFQYFQHLYKASHKCWEFQINFVNDLEENIIQFHRTLWHRIPDRMQNYIDKGQEKQYLRFNMLKVAFILLLLQTLQILMYTHPMHSNYQDSLRNFGATLMSTKRSLRKLILIGYTTFQVIYKDKPSKCDG